MARLPAQSFMGQDSEILTFLVVTRKVQRMTLLRLWELEINNLTFTQHSPEKI